jgi:hypothetical protein
MLTTGAFRTSCTLSVPAVAAAAELPFPTMSVAAVMPDTVTTAAAVRPTRPRREDVRSSAATWQEHSEEVEQQSGSSRVNADDLSLVRKNACAPAKASRQSISSGPHVVHSRPNRAPRRVDRPSCRAGCASGLSCPTVQDRYALVSFSVGAPPAATEAWTVMSWVRVAPAPLELDERRLAIRTAEGKS